MNQPAYKTVTLSAEQVMMLRVLVRMELTLVERGQASAASLEYEDWCKAREIELRNIDALLVLP